MTDRSFVVSIHDVMPDTLDKVEQAVDELRRYAMLPVTLLVVPDTGWTAASLSRLRQLVAAGAILAGHGWRHKAASIRGLRHRLHSLAISRDVAEHLALSRDDVVDLVSRCHGWFAANGLPTPELYVPPAWAMGPARRSDLRSLPFRQYETLTGVYDVQADRMQKYPMVGFEADTSFRAVCCRVWNCLNLAAAGSTRPIRLTIHPGDFELRLAPDLRSLLKRGGRTLSYVDIG